VFESYWKLAVERQKIYHRRLLNQPQPWTNDSILLEHKFTNAYGASDRVSQYLIGDVIYQGEQSPVEWFFRTMLFKFFNSIETWEMLREHFQEIHSETFSIEAFDEVLSRAMDTGRTIYSAAYIMPSGGPLSPHRRKHQMHLHLLAQMLKDELPQTISQAPSMEHAFRLLRAYPTIGDFLAYQYVTDLNYSPLTDFSETEFVCAGPGAMDGIRKCFSDKGGYSDADIIKMMVDRQTDEFARRGLSFQDLWGRPLQLIDCQNLFCEVDKYARIAHPEIPGLSGRTRIKQRFYPSSAAIIRPWFPPKWQINQRVADTLPH
jgi:hypothetical protein